MASRFLQKYHMPDGFQDILSELVREVLRAQPDDMIEFLAKYCEARANGQEYKYDSIYNVKKREIPEQLPQQHYKDLTNQVKNLVKSSNQQELSLKPVKKNTRQNLLDDIPEPQALQDQQQQTGEEPIQEQQQQQDIEQEQEQQQQEEDQQSDQQSNQDKQSQQQQQQQSQRAVSAKSQQSNATSHPEEKGITKEFMGDLYSSAIKQQVDGEQDGGAGGKLQATIEFADFEENREEYENAAKFIQQKYREAKK